ncbi:MAG: helix-turn-helix transcriptional regulator [Deltaproteobacteria bacterium]|nr:helix-turn-helix transcriptional regulator [Deltaproteobacteria bacterium]
MIKLNQIFREVRRAQGIKQITIAGILGLDQSSISKFEDGYPSLSSEKVYEIADLLQISRDFVDGTTDRVFIRGAFIRAKINNYIGLWPVDTSLSITHTSLFISARHEYNVILVDRKKVIAIASMDDTHKTLILSEMKFTLSINRAWNYLHGLSDIGNRSISLEIPLKIRVVQTGKDTLQKIKSDAISREELQALIEWAFNEDVIHEREKIILKLFYSGASLTDTHSFWKSIL